MCLVMGLSIRTFPRGAEGREYFKVTMTEEEVIQNKSKMWIKAFKEARETTPLTVEQAAEMSFSDIMCYIGENKVYTKPAEQLPLINPKIELESAIKEFDKATTIDEVKKVWDDNKKFQQNPEFIKYKNLAKFEIQRKEQEPELDF